MTREARLVIARYLFKEERDGHIQNCSDALKAAGSNTIGTAFIFLDLLEADAEAFAEPFLAHAEDVSA